MIPLVKLQKRSLGKRFLFFMLAIFAHTGWLYLFAQSGEAQEVQYNRDVRPILSNNCFFCHGFDEDNRKADLRLDTFEGATDGGAIDEDDPESSSLIERILSDDPDLVMPPSDSAYRLTAQQKDILQRWVRQGANYEQHWAYKKLVRPEVPTIANAASSEDSEDTAPVLSKSIDAFIARRWKEENVAPVAPATARELIRRLSFDLRGLPPSIEDVENFQADPSESNYQKFVDLWTRSMEYAEHQGLIWLDLVRWADSTGMVSDEPIATGPYRSYVIEAFKNNTPFDQFTREQLAGDLLPQKNDRTMIASGYNRLVKTNSEAGVIEKEALHALKGEHVRAVGTVWLGATTGCAECHDHKYDPITAKDYYSLAAFFDDLIEIGVYDPGDRRFPLRYLYDDDRHRQEDDKLESKIAEIRSELYESEFSAQDRAQWETDTLKAYKKSQGRADWAWMPADLPPARISHGDYQQTETGRSVVAEDDQLVQHSVSEVMTGFTEKISDKKSHLYFDLTIDSQQPPSAVAVKIIHGDYQRQGWKPNYFTTYVWGPEALTDRFLDTVKDPKRVVHVDSLPEAGEKTRLTIPKDKLKSSPHDQVGIAWMQIGGSVTWGDTGFNLEAKKAFSALLAESTNRYWWHLPWNRDDRQHRMKLVTDSLKRAQKDRRAVHRDVIRYAFQESRQPQLVTELRQLYKQLEQVRQHATDEALISATGPLKETKLRDRGNFMDETGELLAPAVPAFLAIESSTDGDRRNNRIDLADWLVDRENPLTARVFVNRLWFQFFGRGISETLEDSGNQGNWPSHPDLLDWLAVEFIESGWDVRHMIQLMVSTRAYRLSSVPSEELAESDPANRLLTRQGRLRHQAEEIRDSALQAAGLLRPTTEIPTQSFFPYQPAAYWARSNKIMFGSRHMAWETSSGTGQYQRSLYTYWKRQNPHPSMLAFDAPTRQECTAKRATTNTPGQALALLNDPIFVEAARALAERVLTNPAATTGDERIGMIFRYALQRDATDEERKLIGNAYESFETHYQDAPKEAERLLQVGQKKIAADGSSAAELAAWTATCRIILNLHEFITRS